jgi:hypothetical protein
MMELTSKNCSSLRVLEATFIQYQTKASIQEGQKRKFSML